MLQRRTALYVAVPVAVILALLIGVLATRKSASDQGGSKSIVGQAVPPVAGTALDGKRFDISQYQGKWVLVNFFASWCAPCQKEHPEIKAWATQHQQAGDGEVVMLVFGDDPARVRQFFDIHGGNWPVVIDRTDDAFSLRFGVTQPPESYLVAPNGIVAAKWAGAITQRDLNQVMAEVAAAADRQAASS